MTSVIFTFDTVAYTASEKVASEIVRLKFSKGTLVSPTTYDWLVTI